jgi:ribonuclease HI
MGETISFTP